MDITESVLALVGSMVIKYKQCAIFHKKSNRRRLLKVYKVYLDLLKVRKFKKGKRLWVRDIFTTEQRFMQGHSNNLVMEMRLVDHQKFMNFLRMSPETFDLLLSTVEPYITKQHIVREPIHPRTRLEITLRYLASGDSMASISFDFRVGKQTVSSIIAEVCGAIWHSLNDKVFMELNERNWKKIAKEFEKKWNFKNCIGAIDGKHIMIQALPNSGSRYYNYKGFHSINLLAITDANYKFIIVDIGAAGRFSDSGIFKNSQMAHGFENNLLNVPSEEDGFPYVLVGDEAFPLTNYLMRPYPRSGLLNLKKKVFNYRLSRARRIVENSFGIIVAKWRIFREPIIASESTVRKIVQACVCLHNFLLIQKSEAYLDDINKVVSKTNDLKKAVSTTDGLKNISRTGTNTFSRNASKFRDRFADFFYETGAVDWQWQKALQNEF